MNKFLLLSISLIFLMNCNSSKEKDLLKKENELLKRELEIQKKELLTDKEPRNTVASPKTKKDNLNKKIYELKSVLNSDGYQTVKMDDRGNFSFDLGSASSGRISGNLQDIFLSIEHRPEAPGCGDICPPMKVIHFKCMGVKDCVTDPVMKGSSYYNKGSISFSNLKVGKQTYDLLMLIKDLL